MMQIIPYYAVFYDMQSARTVDTPNNTGLHLCTGPSSVALISMIVGTVSVGVALLMAFVVGHPS